MNKFLCKCGKPATYVKVVSHLDNSENYFCSEHVPKNGIYYEEKLGFSIQGVTPKLGKLITENEQRTD